MLRLGSASENCSQLYHEHNSRDVAFLRWSSDVTSSAKSESSVKIAPPPPVVIILYIKTNYTQSLPQMLAVKNCPRIPASSINLILNCSATATKSIILHGWPKTWTGTRAFMLRVFRHLPSDNSVNELRYPDNLLGLFQMYLAPHQQNEEYHPHE